MSRRLLKFSGGSVNDYATFYIHDETDVADLKSLNRKS